MKKRFFQIGCVLLLLLGILALAGCTRESDEDTYQVFYLSMDLMKLEPVKVSLEPGDSEHIVDELLWKLQEDPKGAERRRAIPESVKIGKPTFSGNQIYVDLSEDFYELSQTEKILLRAAVVKTLTQLKEYEYVTLSVNKEVMKNEDGSFVYSMSADSFVENPGKQINSSNYTVLTLYFANQEGTGLVKEECEVHYSSNISLDKLVMTKLIEGPKGTNAQATLPNGTKIVTISVADGICYVNLDETLQNAQNNEILEPVILYSIVNSLTELPDVEKVQISINGNSNINLRHLYDLSTLYQRDDSLIVSGNEKEQMTTEEDKNN